MGEWSEYFEDFPEEDDANYVNGVFDHEKVQERKRLLDAQADAKLAALIGNSQHRGGSDRKV
jgi:hypothetical protein